MDNSVFAWPELLTNSPKTAFPSLIYFNNNSSILSCSGLLCLEVIFDSCLYLTIWKKKKKFIRNPVVSTFKDIHNPITSYHLYYHYSSGRCHYFFLALLWLISWSLDFFLAPHVTSKVYFPHHSQSDCLFFFF